MSQRAKAVLLLVVLSAALPELVVGSTPITGLLNPIALIFLLLGYSLPVLVLREYIVRYKIGVAGIIALGVAFGIYNEGLWAKTMIMMQDLPIAQFDMYGRIADVNVPWAVVIGLYHALAAVLLPILIVHYRYKEVRQTPWLSKKVSIFLGAALLVVASISFLSTLRLPGTGTQLTVLLASMALCVIIARVVPGKQLVTAHIPGRLRQFIVGLSLFVVLAILAVMAERATSLVAFFAVIACAIWLYTRLLKDKSDLSEKKLLMFGYGFYIQSALLGLFIGFIVGAPDRIAVGVVAVILFFFLALRLRKQN